MSRIVKVMPAGNAASIAAVHGRFWFVDPATGLAVFDMINGASLAELDDMRERWELRERGRAPRSGWRGGYFVREDGAAVVPFVGVMTKRPNCLADFFGEGGASTLRLVEALEAARRDPDVKDRWVVAETPGGEATGAFAAADYIYSQRGSDKPVFFYGEDQMTSGGQLLASQAELVFGNTNIVSGSVGVMTTIVDSSAAMAQRGLRVVLVKAGDQKAPVVQGMPVTTKGIENVQRRVDSLHALFTDYVQRGYGMESDALARVTNASVYVGAEGVAAGLLDGIATSLEEAIDMARTSSRRTDRSKKSMSANSGANPAASASAAGGGTDDLEDELVLNDATGATVATGSVPYVAADGAAASMTVEQATAMLSAAAAAGASTPDQMATMSQRAQVGDRYIGVLRRNAKSMAILAHGDAGARLAGDIDKMGDEDLLAAIKDYRAVAESKNLAGQGAGRVTAPLAQPGFQQTDKAAVPTGAAGAPGSMPSLADRIAANRQGLRDEGIYG